MGMHHAGSLEHWNYFIALEEDLERLARFVDFAAGKNDSTFSIEIARLLMGASAEVDVVLKQLVRKHNVTTTVSNINGYFPEVTAHCQSFVNFTVLVPGMA